MKPDSFHVTAELKLNVCFIENNVNNLTFSTSILLPASLKVFMSQMMVLDGRLKTLFFIFKAAQRHRIAELWNNSDLQMKNETSQTKLQNT